MKTILLLAAALLTSGAAHAGDKIAPEEYICAQFMAAGVAEAPVFEALQLDGNYAAANGETVADPALVTPILEEVFTVCGEKPEARVYPLWETARKGHPAPTEGKWRADKSTCADFIADEDNASGFIIWLDAYQRKLGKSTASILESDKKANDFMAACRKNPQSLMLDLMKKEAAR